MNELPQDFDGVFKFTNFTEEDFITSWNSIEYTFPAMKSSPMIISGATPEEVQSIRKRFARRLAEREFYKSERFKKMNKGTNVIPATYSDDELTPFIQKCLTPLEIAPITSKALPKDSEKNYKGSKVVSDKADLNSEFRDGV